MYACLRNLKMVPDTAWENPSGVFAIVEPRFSFRTVDGYLQLLRLALAEIPPRYTVQADAWNRRLERISNMAACLRDSRTRFSGKTESLFASYCRGLAALCFDDSGSGLPMPHFSIQSSAQVCSSLDHDRLDSSVCCFYYPDENHLNANLADDMTTVLCNLRFTKPGRNINISYYMQTSGYHEHIHDAVNLLLAAGGYAINCSSTRNGKAHGFDVLEIDHRLDRVECIIRDIEHLC